MKQKLDFPDLKAVLPVKKKRNIELTKTEKRYNKRHVVDRESNSRTYYLQDKEIWYYGKQIQKLTKEI